MSSCFSTCSYLLCEFFSCELPGLRIYFASYIQMFLHQAILIHHRKGRTYIREISEELSMNINFILEVLLILWFYNLSLNWSGSCPQPGKVSEDRQLAREAGAQDCLSTNNTCLSPKQKSLNLHMYPSESSTDNAPWEVISQRQKRGRMQRMQAAVMRTNCWVSLPDCSCGSKEWGIFCFSKYLSHYSDQVFALALPLVPLDMPSLSVQQ